MIIASYYFGSFVRMDHDELSDADVLAVADEWTASDESGFIRRFPREMQDKLSIAWYSPTKLRSMFSAGDLFAWHLFKESKPTGFHVNWLEGLFPPAAYTGAKRTSEIFSELLGQIVTEIEEDDFLPIYEAGLLYSVARNIAMACSWHSAGGLNFSRWAPYRLPEATLAEFLPRALYDKLAWARLAGLRGIIGPTLCHEQVRTAALGIIDWNSNVQRKLLCIDEHLLKQGVA